MPLQNSWNSTLPIGVSYGGTGKNTYSQGDLLVGNQTSGLTALTKGTDNYALFADSSTPTGIKWAAITTAGTTVQTGSGSATAVGQTLTFTGTSPISFSASGSTVTAALGTVPVSLGGTGQASLTQYGLLVGQGTSPVTTTSLTNGQLLIGSTGAAPQAATLTSDGTIGINNTAGAIQLSVSAPGLTVQSITTSGTYTVTNGQNVLITASSGSVILNLNYDNTKASKETKIIGAGTASWKLNQTGSSQAIRFGTVSSTTGTSGYVASTDASDCMSLYCTDNANKWSVTSSQGNFNVN